MTTKKIVFYTVLSMVLILSLGFVLWGPMVSRVEQAKYDVITDAEKIEIRRYPAMIVAQTEVQGEREEAIRTGFRLIADYIFGNNIADKKINMTAPVLQNANQKSTITAPVVPQQNEKIAMTAPVLQQQNEKPPMTAPVLQQQNEKISMTAPVLQQMERASWVIKFVMPSQYTIETLPKPINPAVKIVSIPMEYQVAIRFSGTPTTRLISAKTNELLDYIHQNHLQPVGNPLYAFYNPPWTLPFLRRNEVMFKIEKPS